MAVVRNWDPLTDTGGRRVTVYVGDTRTLTFTIKDKDGTAVNISTWTVRFRCNTNSDIGSASNKIFEKSGTFVTDGTDGKVNLTLTPTELPATAEGEDRHLYIINIASSLQKVVAHLLMDIHAEPDAA